MKRTLTLVAMAAALLVTTPLPVMAETARASATISIHSGPGERYPVVGRLRKNARVELERCTRRGMWCLFNDGDGESVGWVRASYLIGIGAITRATPFRFLVNPDFTPNP